MGMLEEALRLHGLGLSVIPLHPPSMPLQNGSGDKDRGKIPLISWKEFQSRKPKEDEIQGWWTQWPEANIGIVTGKVSGVMVLDVDGEGGRESLSQFQPINGSWSAKTGNGIHHYFELPPEGIACKTGLFPGIDIRGEGGYVVAPPSLHASGKTYSWIHGPTDLELWPMPEFLNGILKSKAQGNGSLKQNKAGRWTSIIEKGVAQGERHTTATKLAGHLIGKGLEKGLILNLMNQFAGQCQPPIPEEEIERIVQDLVKKEDAKSKASGVEAVVRNLDTVKPEVIKWIWYGKIPAGKLTTLVGDPGHGKSYLTLAIAALISNGGVFPDGSPCPKGNVLILTAEDGLEDTIKPRLEKLGADCKRIIAMPAIIKNGKEESISLKSHLEEIEKVIVNYQINLVIIDPLSAYMSDTNSFKETDVRSVLGPLAKLAEKTGTAILGVMHLNKGSDLQAIYRVQGSMAFVGQARSVLAVVKKNNEPEKRVLCQVKNNLAPSSPPRVFQIKDGVLVWDPEPLEHFSLEKALANQIDSCDPSELERAKEFLLALLAEGGIPAKEVSEEAKENGIAERTLIRAKGKLKIKSKPIYQDGIRYSIWSLPEDPQT